MIRWLRPHSRKIKILLLIALIILIPAIGFFGTKLYLYLNFIVGNDIIAQIELSDESFLLLHGEEKNISFAVRVIANPFCHASCSYVFADLSLDKQVDNGSMLLFPGQQFERSYAFFGRSMRRGADFYQLSLECAGVRSFMCSTDGESTQRNALIVARYELTEFEQKLERDLQAQLQNISVRLANAQSLSNGVKSSAIQLNTTLVMGDTFDHLDVQDLELSRLQMELDEMTILWNNSAYIQSLDLAGKTEQAIRSVESDLIKLNHSISADFDSLVHLAGNVSMAIARAQGLQDEYVTDAELATRINKSITQVRQTVEVWQSRASLQNKSKFIDSVMTDLDNLSVMVADSRRSDVLRRAMDQDITYELICRLADDCFKSGDASQRAQMQEFDQFQSCHDHSVLHGRLIAINNSMSEAFVNMDYPSDDEFWQNMRILLATMRNNLTTRYNATIPDDAPNADLMRSLLAQNKVREQQTQYPMNVSPALIATLAAVDSECDPLKIDQGTLTYVDTSFVVPPIPFVDSGSLFAQPPPLCCLGERCTACCLDDSCRRIPVIFLHGHAVNREISAEYSLDAFNKIQHELEKEGYLNAGAITLHTSRASPPGLWGLPAQAITLKTSYYFDLFETPENYRVVQTKSENIDTYAIRLKELIDIIQYKTNATKIDLVAHSMGGLVARRYVQVFGQDKINKLILIATPNSGVVGRPSDFCSFIGENLECRDLSATSLFLNKLNREKNIRVPLYNLVGTGCQMGKNLGDGIVLAENARLDGAINIFINGTCGRLSFLHTEILDPEIYPESFIAIKEALKD